MEQWVVCPKCREKIKFFKIKGKARIEGGTIEKKCRWCDQLVEIYDDFKTRIV